MPFGGQAYRNRARSDAQIVRDVIEAVVHRAPTKADYERALTNMHTTPVVAGKVGIVMSAIGAKADTKLGKLCTSAEAGTRPLRPHAAVPVVNKKKGEISIPRCN